MSSVKMAMASVMASYPPPPPYPTRHPFDRVRLESQPLPAFHHAQSSELEALSLDIDPSENSPLEYYPLPRGTKGERFPMNDPLKESLLEPRPEDRGEYLHGLLQAIARCVCVCVSYSRACFRAIVHALLRGRRALLCEPIVGQ